MIVKVIKMFLLGAVLSATMLVSNKIQAQSKDTVRINIEQALELALNENLTLKISEYDLERVDYLRMESKYALLPSVSANAQYTNNILKPVFFSDFFPGGKMEVGSSNSYAVTGTLQVPLFSLALYKNIQLSEIELRSVLESARSTKLDLLMQVKNTFYGIIMMKESVNVLEQSYKNAKESADNIRNMFEKGMASEYDKIRTDVAVRNILPSLSQAKNALEMAKMQLKVLLSLKMDQPIELEGDFKSLEKDVMSFAASSEINLSENSNLKSLDIQMDKLKKNMEIVNSQRLPSLAGFMNYQLQMQSEKFTFNNTWANSLSAGFVIQIPIFNKLSLNMKEKQIQVGIKQMEFQKQLLSENMTLAVKNAINEMNRAKIQLESDLEAVKQAQKGFEISKVRYSTGAGTVLELNDTEVALTKSRLNLNQTIYDFIKARNEYEKILGQENNIKQ